MTAAAAWAVENNVTDGTNGGGAMSWAVGNGVVQGASDGRLNPEGAASRAHFAVFLQRFCMLYGIA